ncbi:MAG: molybdenum cofactor biosynthesis protein MoaE [Flavobacteriaceae bacterium]|nr:molybdenum cofactor biosynthesis protein MoaE [Flavobacteriaceae bacterium]
MTDSNIDIQILDDTLKVERCRNFISSPTCGGEVIFVGTVRNATKGKSVVRLEFEAYKKMAISEMTKIANYVVDKFEVERIAIHHRTGVLDIGEIPVIIAVSSAHRKAAFKACEYAIDTLKETVPIWKKEIFEDGEVWVAAHP